MAPGGDCPPGDAWHCLEFSFGWLVVINVSKTSYWVQVRGLLHSPHAQDAWTGTSPASGLGDPKVDDDRLQAALMSVLRKH